MMDLKNTFGSKKQGGGKIASIKKKAA